MQTSQIEALDDESTGTRVVFEWCGDRFRHSIFAVRLGEASLLAESLEGDSTDIWPTSPPLQQLHKQPSPTGRDMLLLTGMAGKSHWSGSITTSTDLRWTQLGFAFACRYRNSPEWMGVTYRIADNIHFDRNLNAFHLNDELQYELYPSAIGTSLATENIVTSTIDVTDRTIRITAKETPHLTTATTNQWAYEIRLTRPYWLVK